MEFTRRQRFAVILHDKDDKIVKKVAGTEALDLAIEAANAAKRKPGEYATVYAEIGVSR